MIEFDRRQFEEYARAVFTTDSPSGCTADAIALIKSYVEELGYTTHVHNKGTLEVDVPGLDAGKTVATSAHVDTLGMMVRSVKSGGTLALTKVGGPICPTLDGEYCTVLTREGRRYSGTILSLAPAVHVYPDAATMPRDADHLEVRQPHAAHIHRDELIDIARERARAVADLFMHNKATLKLMYLYLCGEE